MNLIFNYKYDIIFTMPLPETNKLFAIKAKDSAIIYVFFSEKENKFLDYKLNLDFTVHSILENMDTIDNSIDWSYKYFYVFNCNYRFVINK